MITGQWQWMDVYFPTLYSSLNYWVHTLVLALSETAVRERLKLKLAQFAHNVSKYFSPTDQNYFSQIWWLIISFQPLYTIVSGHNSEECFGDQELVRDPVWEGHHLQCDEDTAGWGHGPLGSQGGESGGEGCPTACPAPESHGCWGWSCKRRQSQGEERIFTSSHITYVYDNVRYSAFLSFQRASTVVWTSFNKSKCQLKVVFQVIAAEGEHKASSALKEAAHVIEDSPHALQVNNTTLWQQWEFSLGFLNINTANKHQTSGREIYLWERKLETDVHTNLQWLNKVSQSSTANPTQIPIARRMNIPPILFRCSSELWTWEMKFLLTEDTQADML